jgi:hypothetical protein
MQVDVEQRRMVVDQVCLPDLFEQRRPHQWSPVAA